MIDFKRMRDLMRAMPEMLWKIEVASANASRVTANITGMPRGGGTNNQENSYIALAEITDVYREAEAELNEMREELKAMLENFDDVKGKAYLRYRYLNGRTLDEIAQAEGKDRSTVWRIISDAEYRISTAQNG